MRAVSVGKVTLRLEAAEAGGRYLAPILVLPGLFQSYACWRGMTSMLAHRGWNVYVLARSEVDDRGAVRTEDHGWEEAVARAAEVAGGLDERVVVFGADLGAALALAMLDRVRPLALGLFAPVLPAALGHAYRKSLGFFERRRAARENVPVAPPAALVKTVHRPTDAIAEPAALIRDLATGVAFEPSREHPPALVFAPESDPLVAREDALAFADSAYARAAPSRLGGRWWPSSHWEPIADEIHRFLILTLADRVVEFPEEVLED